MITFLQISDIHFTDASGNDDEYAQMKRKFLEDIAECRNRKGTIDYILICGDVAFSGMESQYRKAKEFITQICENTKCSENNIFVVPGNHDKEWDVYKGTRQMMRDMLLKGKNTKQLLESKVKEPMAIGILYTPFKQYYKLAYEYSCISEVALKATSLPKADQEMEMMPKFKPNDAFFWSEVLGDLHGYPVQIHGSNTSLLSDKDDGESKNLKEGKHLQILPLQTYNVTAGSDEIHILMLHHPMSEIIDGKKIGEDIDGRFKLQFYGHVHKQSSSSDGAIKIYSGALQPEEDNNDEYFPVYNVIEMDVVEEGGKPYLKVDVFSRKWNGTNFVEYQEETKTGAHVLKVELQQNDSWKKTMERQKESHHDSDEAAMAAMNPHAMKNAFLHSGREGKIINEMYGDLFDGISRNRIKYVEFLKKVETDGRMDELNSILKRYGR